MREAKLEKPNPDTKKSAATAIRICLGEEVRGEIRDLIMNTRKNKEADWLRGIASLFLAIQGRLKVFFLLKKVDLNKVVVVNCPLGKVLVTSFC